MLKTGDVLHLYIPDITKVCSHDYVVVNEDQYFYWLIQTQSRLNRDGSIKKYMEIWDYKTKRVVNNPSFAYYKFDKNLTQTAVDLKQIFTLPKSDHKQLVKYLKSKNFTVSLQTSSSLLKDFYTYQQRNLLNQEFFDCFNYKPFQYQVNLSFDKFLNEFKVQSQSPLTNLFSSPNNLISSNKKPIKLQK